MVAKVQLNVKIVRAWKQERTVSIAIYIAYIPNTRTYTPNKQAAVASSSRRRGEKIYTKRTETRKNFILFVNLQSADTKRKRKSKIKKMEEHQTSQSNSSNPDIHTPDELSNVSIAFMLNDLSNVRAVFYMIACIHYISVYIIYYIYMSVRWWISWNPFRQIEK